MLWAWASGGKIDDRAFALRAQDFFGEDIMTTNLDNSGLREAIGFEDILLAPAESAVKPAEVSTKTKLTRKIELQIPLASAPVDNVTESVMAITMAQLGGIGIIHGNMPLGRQVEEVRRVKRAEGEIVSNPITISPDSSVAEAFDLMTTYKISGLPVIDQASKKVAGIITSRDIRFFEDYAKPVKELMTEKVVTAQGKLTQDQAKKIFHQNRVEKIVLVDAEGRCTGLMTVKDIEKLSRHPNAARDSQGRLLVGAAVGVGKEAFDRAGAMTDAGVDVIFVDMSHGHTKDALSTVSRIRQQRSSEVEIVAGNVATLEAARSCIDAGADAVKVGVGQTGRAPIRGLAGVGMPQLSALFEVVEQCSVQNVPVIVSGGIGGSADFAKAIAAGGGCVVLDDLLAGADETPGEIVYRDGQAYKVLQKPSTPMQDPYRIAGANDGAPVAYKGPIKPIINHFVEALRAAMAYAGAKDIKALHETARFVRAG